MKAFFTLAVVGYAVAWFLLLIDCMRRKEFYPVFGRGWGTKIFWLLTFAFFNPLLTLLYFMFGWFAKPDARSSSLRSACVVVPVLAIIAVFSLPIGHAGSKPITIRRDPKEGRMVAEGGKSKGIEAQVGVIKVNDGMNFTSTLSSSDHSRFPCRRILILNQSSHRLMERVAVEVQKRLSQLPFVEEVVYLPAGRHPAEGRLAPDVTILLDMPRIKQIKLPLYRILDATILVAAGSTPYPSSSHYTDHTTPPVLDFKWNGDLSHKSRMIGYETASARYTLAANDIAGEIAKGLSKQLTEWTDKSGSMPTLPDSFYGTYHPPAKMSFLPGDSLECVQSNRGLMKHNETAWRFADNRDTTIALDAIKRQLEGEGWKDYDSEVAGKNSSALRMTRETERLVAFRQEHRFMARQLEVSKPGKPRPTMPLIVHYEDVFSDQETEKALRDLLESGAPSDTLVIFEKFFVRGGLRDRFCEAIEKRPAASVEANIALAQLYQSRGEKDKACRALFRARASLRTLREHADLQRKVEELAQEIGDKKLAEAPIPDEVFREAGFVEITSAPATIEREVGLNEPVVFYHKAAGNTPNTIMCARETICRRRQHEPL